MKFKIILVIGFLLIACLFVLFTKRRTYYSISGEKAIIESHFELSCEQLDGGSDADKRLEVYFKFPNIGEVSRKDFKVLPIINGKDTLQLKSVYGNSHYSFSFPANGTEQLNLFINYKVDSAGVITNESKKYYNLEKVYTYRFRIPFQ
jgi:hypothetical protein